jgi:hypothetical protein
MSLSSSQLLPSFQTPVNGVFEGQDPSTYDKMMMRDVTVLRHLRPGSEARVWAFYMLSQCCKAIAITTAMTITKTRTAVNGNDAGISPLQSHLWLETKMASQFCTCFMAQTQLGDRPY